MKRFRWLLLLVIAVGLVGVVAAQDDSSMTGSEGPMEVIVLDDVLVICPGDETLPAVRAAAELVIQFGSQDAELVIPFARVIETDGNLALEIGRFILGCESSDEEVLQVDRSPAVELNEPAPQPSNPEGLGDIAGNYLIVVTGPANLRSCDEPTCSQVGIVRGGTELIPIGRNLDRSWWYVQAGDVRGWIWGELIAVRGDVTDIPVVETAGETAIPRVYIGYTGNPIYDELSAGGQVICAVQGGAEYALLGRNSDTSWVFIEAACTDGNVVQGWVNALNVAIRNPGNVFVPVVAPDGSRN